MYVHQNIVSKIMKAPRFQGQVGLLTRENFANALGCYVLSKKSKMKAWKSHVQHSTFEPNPDHKLTLIGMSYESMKNAHI